MLKSTAPQDHLDRAIQAALRAIEAEHHGQMTVAALRRLFDHWLGMPDAAPPPEPPTDHLLHQRGLVRLPSGLPDRGEISTRGGLMMLTAMRAAESQAVPA